MTWVAIRGHGIVEVRPFPNYMQELIHSYLPYSQQHLGRDSHAARKRQYTGLIVDPEAAFDPLRAASHLAAQASCARESLPERIFGGLHPANVAQRLQDVPFFCVRKPLAECALFVADTLDTGGEARR